MLLDDQRSPAGTSTGSTSPGSTSPGPGKEASHPGRMTARAALTCERRDGADRLTRLRSEGQFVLRPTHPKGFEPFTQGAADVARVSVSAGAAGPLGGDRLSLDVHVGPGAVLVLNEISATLALPGTSAAQSLITFTVTVDEDATLIWLPEPVIAARNCDHRQNIRVSLASSARFFLREELIVGRHNEDPGNIQQHVRVVRDGSTLYDQHLRLGDRYAGWDSPTVADGSKAVGNILVVDPGSGIGRGRADLIRGTGPGLDRAEGSPASGSSSDPRDVPDVDAASVGIADDVVAAGAVATDSLALSRSLDEALRRLGSPWSPPAPRPSHT